MIIVKTRSARAPLLVAVLLLAGIVALSLNKQRIKEELYSAVDTVMAQDWGISGPSGYMGGSIDHATARTITGAILRLPAVIMSKVEGFPGRPEIERIDIDIKFEDYQKILADRKRALANGILSEPQEVKARIRHNGRRIKADIRLKGDLQDHWRSRTSMSLRVALKGKDTIFGFSQFSLHKPGSRQFPYDYVFQDFMRESGGLAARHNFVRVTVNGQNWGVMDIEEHMSKELLEKQEAKESIILKFGDEQKWHYDAVNDDPYPHYRLSDRLLYISPFQEKKYLADPLARSRFSYVVEKLSDGREADILDTGSFSRAAAAAMIWNIYHTLGRGNSRYYFNPYTLKLEPITTDQARFVKIETDENPVQKLYDADSGWLYKTALSSPQGQQNFRHNLDTVLKAAEKIPALTAYYQSFFPNDQPHDFSGLMDNVNAVRRLAEPLPASAIPAKPAFLKQAALTPAQAKHLPAHVLVRHYDDGRLVIFNLLDVPVNLETVTHNGALLQTGGNTIPPFTENDGRMEIETGKTGIQDGLFEVVTSVIGQTRVARNTPTLVTGLFNPLQDEGTAHPEWLTKKHGEYEVTAGKWNVDKPLVVKGALAIAPGTTLRFAQDAYLIVISGTLTASGTADRPIVFEPQGAHWKGLYVMEADGLSVLRHVTIKDTDFFRNGLLSLTGGVSFYKSPVHIENTSFSGTIAEDALNIIKSDFSISRSVISGTRSDAFDSDFSDGRITDTTFENTGGDAADFSGSTVTIEGMTARNIRDKAVSSGEKSTISIQNSNFSGVGVGIAAKDGSVVTADAVIVSDYALHAAMAYVKKDMFGAPEMRILKMKQDGDTPFLCQTGSKLYVDGTLIKSLDIDIEKLYGEGIMKK